jgi:hypothetical protein
MTLSGALLWPTFFGEDKELLYVDFSTVSVWYL